MAVVALSDRPEDIWIVARSAFTRLLDRAIDRHSGTDQIVKHLHEAKALDGLHTDRLEPSVSADVSRALRETLVEILAESDPSDEKTSWTEAEFMGALTELLQMIDRVTSRGHRRL